MEIRKSTGIPRSFMVPVEGPAVPGAMMTPSGQFAVPSIGHQAYLEGKKPSAPEGMQAKKPNIPEDLVCSICNDLLTDTVMVPCCGTSFCDECIRMVLLESENHQCPDCKEQGVSPDTLIPNRYLRTAVNNFRNQTGYQRAPHHHINNQVISETVYHQPSPVQSSALVIVNTTESLHPPGVDVEPLKLPKRTQMTSSNMDSRSSYAVSKVEERAPTPTIDERANVQALPTTFPDTSVPPPIQPAQTFQIQPIGTIMPFPTGGFASGPFPRGPIMPMFPNMGPGPRSNYPMDPSRGMRSGGGYNRSYSRNRGRGIHSYRGNNNNIQTAAIIEDPVTVFLHNMLRDENARNRQLRRQRRSFSRSRLRSRSRSRSPPLRKRSRSRSLTPRISRSRSRSISRSLSRQRSSRHISRSHSVSPRPTRTPAKPSKPPSRSPVRSRTRSRSRSVSRVRSRSRSRSAIPRKRRTPSFTMSRSRSRSLSRSPSPLRRDRHYSPHRHDVRYRSPLPGRNSPERYGSRNKDYDNSHGYYEQDIRRGRGRGRYPRGRGNVQSNDYKDQYYPPSNTRYDSRYETNQSSRSYAQSSNVSEVVPQQRYNNRRFEPFDIIPPGTGPDLPTVTTYRGYQDEYLAPPGVDHRIVTFPSDGKRDRDAIGARDNVRDLAARDWERTRDREIEQRERERQREYEDRYGYQKRQSQSPSRDKHRKRTHETKENKHHPVQAIESVLREHFNSEPKDEGRIRVPVLVDLKKEPSVEKEKKKDVNVPPVKEKKKEKEKRKKRKEGEGEKKKEKKEVLTKGKVEIKVDTTVLAKVDNKIPPVEVRQAVPLAVEKIDALYGDIEGTSVDQTVVENYLKIDDKNVLEENEIVKNNKDETPVAAVEAKEPVVLAPLPELSKWELEEDMPSQEDKSGGEDGSGKDKKVVTSEVLKRAENAIFQKAINAIRPFDTSKKSVIIERPKEKKEPEQPIQQKPAETVVDSREARKIANTIQITIPTSLPSRVVERSVEVAQFTIDNDQIESTKVKTRLDRSKFTPTVLPSTSPVRLSAKERLGAKIDQEDRNKDDSKRVRSAVERKSKSRSPRKYLERKVIDREKQRETSPGSQSQRRVVVSSRVIGRVDSRDKDRRNVERSRSGERRYREKEKRKERSSSREKRYKKDRKHDKVTLKKKDDKPEERQVTVKLDTKTESVSDKKIRKYPRLATDRKKVTLDEASFEPDYDESTSPESEPEVPGEEKTLLINVSEKNNSDVKKRSRSVSVEKQKKKQKPEAEVEEGKSVDKIVKEDKNKKAEVITDDSSDTDSSSDSSSDSSIEAKKKHRKKKKSKKRKKKKSRKRKDTSSESDSSDSSSSDSESAKGKKKKHKHRSKKRKSKKSKKSKHK